jgi:hypothetical protein
MALSEPRRAALAYLEGHNVLTLATHGPSGLWAAAVFYANDGFSLVFLSTAHTRHAQNLAARPRAAGTVQDDTADWPSIQGIQLEGLVQALEGADRAAAIALYEAKYPFLREPPAELEAALARVRWYRLVPDRLYWIDNRQGFGHREEIDLARPIDG